MKGGEVIAFFLIMLGVALGTSAVLSRTSIGRDLFDQLVAVDFIRRLRATVQR